MANNIANKGIDDNQQSFHQSETLPQVASAPELLVFVILLQDTRPTPCYDSAALHRLGTYDDKKQGRMPQRYGSITFYLLQP